MRYQLIMNGLTLKRLAVNELGEWIQESGDQSGANYILFLFICGANAFYMSQALQSCKSWQ